MAKRNDSPSVDGGLYNQKAERATLGALLIDPGAIYQASEWLIASDFYEARHGQIYQAMRDLSEGESTVDYVTLCNLLVERSQLEAVGGASYLTGLSRATPSALQALKYGRIVQRLGTLRRLAGVAGEIAKLAYSEDADVGEVFERARQLVDTAAPMDNDKSVMMWAESLGAFVNLQLERQAEQSAIEKGAITASVRLPFKGLQGLMQTTIRPGMLAIVAAESSVGKTAFMENCAEHWAQQGLNVAFFHFELNHQLMLDRRMCRWSGMPMTEIETGRMDSRIDRATEALQKWRGGVHYVHCPGWTMGRVAAKARQLAQKGLCDVTIVDYLNKARLVYNNGANKATALGDAVETLKTLGEQLAIPIVLGSQFSKASRLADRKTGEFIRDSGEPEDKANVVITLNRPILNETLFDSAGAIVALAGSRSPIAEVRIDKNTNGPTGDTRLVMVASRFMFRDPMPEELMK